MEAANKNIIYQGNSVISIENLSEYSQPVIVKKPSKKDVSRWIQSDLEREYEMARSLDMVEGVRKALGQKQIKNQQVLILEYIEGETLRDHILRNKLNIRSRLEIAIDMARILGKIHQQNIIHLNINSKNLLIGKKQHDVHFIDLGSAAFVDRGGYTKIQPDQPMGDLPYISPEQTGRINRTLDERSDLYSLGVVLYELMTGQLPFDSKDPMEIVHHHIAGVPDSPSKVTLEVPEVLSAIILKMLSKNAEDRYQSAAGLQNDLEKCLQRLNPEGAINDFPLGETDYASWLRFPQKLYGRESELEELVDEFESVYRGIFSIVFVSGYSGIGKTALVEELNLPVSEKNGYFIQGKFDQYVSTPFTGITQALALLVTQILTQNETQLAAWRSKILEAVGPNGKVLTNVVPGLELVIGPQPAVPNLSAQEAQNRFNFVFQRFFGAIAHSEHPICFFLDDLQWVDPASLGLLKALITYPDLAHLLVVGAYRDNEVHADHPLMMLITDLEKAGVKFKQMTLPKLAETDIEALNSDALRCDPGEVRELSRLIYAQTNGNPFFTRQVLRSMEDQGLLALNTADGSWRWDMDALSEMNVTASVVELLVSKLKELPADTQETLKVAACIGNQFDIAALTEVTAGDDETILDHVLEAIAAGLIWARDDRGFFVHDRVQEAAYALVPIEERDRLHLTIGRLLLQRHRASDQEQDIYRIVDQLNHGLHLVDDEQERMQIAELNLQAAQTARQTSAFETGLSYALAGIELLGENSWNQDYHLTLALHEQATLLANAAGDIPAMKHHSELVLQFGIDPLDLSRVQKLHIEFLLSSKCFDEAIDFGLKALSILGQEFPPNPDMEFSTAKLSELLDRLEREPPDYLSMPRLCDQDPEFLAASEILLPVANAAFAFRPPLAPLIYMRSLELSLERQLLSEHTPAMIAVAGLYANALLGKVDLAYAFGETAVELASRQSFHSSLFAALHVHALYNYFWRKPLRETLDLFDRVIQIAHDFGNNEFVSYGTFGWSKHAFYASFELAHVEERSLRLRTFLDSIQYVTQSRYVNIFVTATEALRGGSSARCTSWRGTPFDDDRDLTDLHRVKDHLGLLYAYCTKAWVATLFGDHDGVEEYSDLSWSFLVVAPSGLEKAILAFICGLRRARELRENPDESESEQDLEEYLDSLERFAGLAPMNFAHKLSLVRAEVHRIRGEVLPAMRAYEQASRGARENGYLSEAGLAHALAAEFFRDFGLHQAALHNAEQAAQAWQSWGAYALVESLSKRLPDLLEPSDLSWQSSSDAGKVPTTITQPISSIQLDLDSITSMARILSAETGLEQLLSKMITLVMANSGAATAVLLLKQDTDWLVQAWGNINSQKYEVLLNQPLESVATDGTGFVPESVYNYCKRSKEVLIVGDARSDDRFAEDMTVKARNIKSMACIPVIAQGECKSMLYLENCQVTDVFTGERIELLKYLSTQFGVSVENALLYANLNQKIEALKESETRFRSVVENANEAIVVTQDEVVKYCNPKIKELSGYSQEEILLQRFDVFIHPDDLEVVLREYRARLSGERPRSNYSVRIITKDGQEKHIFVNSALVDWDDKPATLAMITDITEQFRVREELEDSEERFRRLMEESPLAMEILTPDGKIIKVNTAWMNLWNVNEKQTETVMEKYNMRTNKQLKELGFLPLVEKAFSGQDIVLPPFVYDVNRAVEELGIESSKLRSPWIQSHLYSVKDRNNKVAYVVNTYMDLTELKQAEKEAREHREVLARVDRATKMGQLSGSIAHELNQPLTGALSNAQAAELLIRDDNLDSDEFMEIIKEIIANTKRAGDVLHNLRELYGEQKGEHFPLDINSVVTETARLLHSELVEKNIVLTIECTPSMPLVKGNRIQIQQVLVNLVMNGIQAMQDTVQDDRRIHIATNKNEHEIEVQVEDRGTGIDEDKIGIIFEPLVTWKPGGTGMGLAINNSIIEAHGGRMWAENKKEGGVCVGFTVPKLKAGQKT
jgi:PAS domain S-box-containing protein